nr:PREDICTED: chondroitin sulfate proteoglycan 5 [Bos mutus]
MRSSGPGCARSGALAADGLGLIRLEPGRSTSPPCLALSAPAPPSWVLGDLPETLRPEHRVGAEIREAPCALGSAHWHSAGWGLRPLRPFRAPPRACGCLGAPLCARRLAAYPFQGTLEPHPASDIIDIDYFEGLDGEGRGADLGSFPGSPGTSEHHPDPGGETPSWSLLDLYDDFTPFDESDFYPTTSFYDDLDEEEEEEEDKDAVGGGDLEDENDLLVPTEKPGLGPGTGQPTSRWHAVPPQHTLGMVPGSSIALRPRPGEPGRDLAPSENGTVCRSGFVRHNGSCRSVCDLFPSYCHNGGQCYLVENIGAFCRCNTQDYIWHKGMRCESIITDFQVMCVAVGSAALVLLLLFMMTVFFAKKLYLLKTENTKLRRTNKFRTPSELHNDNFSLSTIAEGSHPNDDSSAPHKIQEALKSCLKEEEPFNIQNSMSPKLEGGKGDQADLEVNCLQNNLT